MPENAAPPLATIVPASLIHHKMLMTNSRTPNCTTTRTPAAKIPTTFAVSAGPRQPYRHIAVYVDVGGEICPYTAK